MAYSEGRTNYGLGILPAPRTVELGQLVSALHHIKDLAEKGLSAQSTLGLKRDGDAQSDARSEPERFSKMVSNIKYFISNIRDMTNDVHSPLNVEELKALFKDAAYGTCEFYERIDMFTYMVGVTSSNTFGPDEETRKKVNGFFSEVKKELEPRQDTRCWPEQ